MSLEPKRKTIRLPLVLLILGCIIGGAGCGSITTSSSRYTAYRESVYRSLINLASARTPTEQEKAAEDLVILLRNKRPIDYTGISAHVLPHDKDLAIVKWESLE